MDKLHWALDSLVLREDTFFGYGWLFHEEKTLRHLRLEIGFAASKATSLMDLECDKPRDDVAAAYPGHATAQWPGYMIFGGFPQPADTISGLTLIGSFDDGEPVRVEIPLDRVTPIQVRYPRSAFPGHAWRLLKRGKLRRLYWDYRMFLQYTPKSPADSPDYIPTLLRQQPGPIAMVIDHDLGGGANRYKEQWAAEKIKAGFTVLALSFQVATLTHVLTIQGQELAVLIHGLDSDPNHGPLTPESPTPPPLVGVAAR